MLGLEPRPNVSYPRGLASLAGLGSRRFAVIDVGTNSVKFHVAERVARAALAAMPTAKVAILTGDDGSVRGIKVQKMVLGEPDAKGRRQPIPQDEFLELECDTVIYALGTKANPIVTKSTPGLELNKWGYIVADADTQATSVPGVFAGGDIVTGAATVIQAMGAGRKAARAMKAWLGLRDTDVVYASEAPRSGRRFGFAPDEHGYARVRVG